MWRDFRNTKPTVADFAMMQGLWRNHPRYDKCIGHWLMNEGGGLTVYDLSGNGNHGTLTGPTWGLGQVGYETVFDGTDAYIRTTDDFFDMGTSDFTISAFVKASSTQVSTLASIVYKGATGTGSAAFGYWLAIDASGFFDVWIGNGTTRENHELSGINLRDDTYHRITCVIRRGVSGDIYLDNNAVDSSASALTGSIDSGFNMDFGARGTGLIDLDFTGSIADIRIYKRALAEYEVRSLYYHPYLEFEWASALLRQPYFSVPTLGTAAPAFYYRMLLS